MKSKKNREALRVGIISVLCLLAVAGCRQVATKSAEAETKQQHDRRMAWWRQAKLGMFIHWGIYAVPAGTYKNKRIDGPAEWIMHRAGIPIAEYEPFAKQFNPIKFDADQWVRLAK